MRLPLTLVRPRKRKRPLTFPRPKAVRLVEDCLEAPDLFTAGTIIRTTGRKLPQGAWRTEFLHLGRRLQRGLPLHRVFIEDGNDKLPFVHFSTLPWWTCPGMGLCGRFCYSLRAWRGSKPFGRQLQNTLLMKHRVDVVCEAFFRVAYGSTLRLYVDGDFAAAREVDFWMRCLKERPDVRAYAYSKSWDELYEWGRANEWPPNFVLNLSSGGRTRAVTKEQMLTLPVTRGEFVAVPIGYRPPEVIGNWGFKRYDDPRYFRAVRESARRMGVQKFFACPGKCGSCTSHGPACGLMKFKGVTVVNGIH
jgi:hypothetical protein